MFTRTLKTWTFSLVIAIILPNLISSAPVNEEPKTMYEALVQKCPEMNKTELLDNMQDIFNKQCSNWTAIKATATPAQGKDNAQCIVLYESLLSYCTSFGESIVKFKELLPKASMLDNVTIEQICSSNKSLSSLLKTERNIANILQPINCMFTCADIGESQPVVHEACKFSYYFVNFETAKFLSAANSLKKSTLPDTKIEEESAGIAPIKENKPEIAINEHVESEVKAQKPQQTNHDEEQHPPEQVALPVEPKPGAKTPKAPEVAPDLQKTADKVPSDIEEVQVKGDVNPPAPNKASEEEIKQVEAPKIPQVEPAVPDDNQANNDVAQEHEGFGNEDDDFDQGDEIKGEPVLEDVEQKSSSRKVKPETVEDEAVNSYNTPEDDMDGDSYFFSYFTVLMCLFVIGYVGYHNRQKILALLLEGKRGKRNGRQGRRPNSANYHKLDSNLEEAISSSCSKNASNVIY